MEIGDLMGKIRGGDKSKPKNFLAIELTDEIVQAAVWYVDEGKTNISAIGTPVEWDGDKANPAELVTAADATVSSAIEGLEEEPGEVVFGVANSWAGPEGITADKLKLLKKVCGELELKPLGFVVVTDSLLRYLRMQEGTPSTSILVHVARDSVTVSLVQLGKLISSEVMGRSDDIAFDVEEGISRFKLAQELPSRFLVFDGMHNLEEIVQTLNSYDWKQKFNFLHIPKIESLPHDVLIRSIAVAGGSEVAKAIGFDIAENAEPVEAEAEQETQDAAVIEPNVIPVTSAPLDGLLSAEDFGFAPLKKTAPAAQASPNGGSIAMDSETVSMPAVSTVNLRELENTPIPQRKFSSSRRVVPRHIPKITLPAVALPGLPQFKLPKFSLPSRNFSKLLIFGGIGLLVLIVVFVSAVWLVPKAHVTVYVSPKDLPATLDITLSTSATEVDEASFTVPASPVERTVAGEESVPATGDKTVGDPAKGEVVIFNRTSAAKTFPANTVLTAKSLKFTLDSSVTVASKSAGADYVDVPGKSAAKITARAIGTDSNLSESTEFTLESFAKESYIAKNVVALSGGSSREVTVVDKADQTALLEALLSKLRDQAGTELKSQLGEGFGVYPLQEGSEIIEEKYSAQVGEEASSLTGSFQVMVKGVSYKNIDFDRLISSKIASSMPSGYERTPDAPEIELGEAKEESSDSVQVEANVTVKSIPVLDQEKIATAIRGLSALSVDESLANSVVGFKDSVVEITPPWLPTRFKRLPRNIKNISVEIIPAEF